METCTNTLESNMTVSQKIGTLPTSNKATPLLGIFPKDYPSYHTDTCSNMFIVALFITSRNNKCSRCTSTEERMKKMWYIYTTEYYPAIKKHGIMKFESKWIDLLKNHPEWGNSDPERPTWYVTLTSR